MCYCATSEREREKQSSSLFFISFYCKVIVIFCVRSTDESRESNVVLCERIASFFFLCAGEKKKSTNTLNNATPPDAVFFATTVQIFFLSAASNPHTYS